MVFLNQVFCTLVAELGTIPTIPGPAMWPHAVPPWPYPWATVPQGYAYPIPQPQVLPQPLPQGTAPSHDPWSVAGADPWAATAAAAAAATSVAGTGMGSFPGPVTQPPTYPAPGMGNFGAQSWPNKGAGTAPGPDPLPSSATAAQPTFQGLGGLDASQSVIGMTAEFLLTQTRKNIEAQLQLRASAGWRQIAKDLSAQQGKKECPSWDGKDPGRTLRGWLRMQLRWQIRTPSPPEQWGVLLLEALPTGTLSRAMAETIPEQQLFTTDGYILILQKILNAHQAYLEAELEKAAVDFLYPRHMDKGELFTTYVAYLELLGRELDQQLNPSPPLDERLKVSCCCETSTWTRSRRFCWP